MKPIHEMTHQEWLNLDEQKRDEYPTINLRLPSNNDYYLSALRYHVRDGGKITKRIWNDLTFFQQEELVVAATFRNG